MASYGKQVAAISEVPAVSHAVWNAAAELINYRSQSAIPDWSGPPPSNLPNCTDNAPEPGRILSVGDKQFTASVPTYENCRFTLDSAVDNSKVNAWLIKLSGPAPLVFKHCLVVYRGGVISLVSSIHGPGFVVTSPGTAPIVFAHPFTQENPVQFSDCRFDLELDAPPHSSGQDFTRALLESDEKDGSMHFTQGREWRLNC